MRTGAGETHAVRIDEMLDRWVVEICPIVNALQQKFPIRGPPRKRACSLVKLTPPATNCRLLRASQAGNGVDNSAEDAKHA